MTLRHPTTPGPFKPAAYGLKAGYQSFYTDLRRDVHIAAVVVKNTFGNRRSPLRVRSATARAQDGFGPAHNAVHRRNRRRLGVAIYPERVVGPVRQIPAERARMISSLMAASAVGSSGRRVSRCAASSRARSAVTSASS